jgi:hypothetical protein
LQTELILLVGTAATVRQAGVGISVVRFESKVSRAILFAGSVLKSTSVVVNVRLVTKVLALVLVVGKVDVIVVRIIIGTVIVV